MGECGWVPPLARPALTIGGTPGITKNPCVAIDDAVSTGMVDNAPMRVSAKADYAIRAAAELAATDPTVPLKAERISDAQDIPIKFLETILLDTMYELPSLRGVSKVVIDETVIDGQTKPYIVYKSEPAEEPPRRAHGIAS